MNGILKIWKDRDEGSWFVEVIDCEGCELFWNRTAFKLTAYISYYIWKKIMRHFEGTDVKKDIKL